MAEWVPGVSAGSADKMRLALYVAVVVCHGEKNRVLSVTKKRGGVQQTAAWEMRDVLKVPMTMEMYNENETKEKQCLRETRSLGGTQGHQASEKRTDMVDSGGVWGAVVILQACA